MSAAQRSKKEGNEAFKQGNYQLAVEYYTSAMKADPSDHILPCNRAMARLKLEQWNLAEQDSTRSLDLLPSSNCKAYFRRGLARKGLKKWKDAQKDLEAASKIEPSNESITVELEFVKSQLQETNARASTGSASSDVAEQSSLHVPSSPSLGSLSSLASSSPAAQSSTSNSSSDTETLLNQYSSLTNGLKKSPEPDMLREVSTRRFDSNVHGKTQQIHPSKSSTTAPSAAQGLCQTKDELPCSNGHQACAAQDSARSAAIREVCNKEPASKIVNDRPKAPSSSLVIPITPINSFLELERRWGMSSKPETRWSIMKSVDPSILPQLFGQHLEPVFLDQIIEAFQVPLSSKHSQELKCACMLIQGFERVHRLQTLAMFLEPVQKQVIRDLVSSLESSSSDYRCGLLPNWGL